MFNIMLCISKIDGGFTLKETKRLKIDKLSNRKRSNSISYKITVKY